MNKGLYGFSNPPANFQRVAPPFWTMAKPFLTAGTYTILAKDANGCTGSTTAVIAVPTKGPLFTQVRNLITSRCGGGGCHMNGYAAKGYNFDDDCSIIRYKNTINSVCSSNYMPPSPFSTAEKAIITNWLNAGGKYNN